MAGTHCGFLGDSNTEVEVTSIMTVVKCGIKRRLLRVTLCGWISKFLVRTTVQFRRGIYNMEWSDWDVHICRIGFGVPYFFFSHVRCPKVKHSTACMEQVHAGSTEIFAPSDQQFVLMYLHNNELLLFQWFSFLILHTISMLQGMFDVSSKFNDILFDQTDMAFLSASVMCFIMVSLP